MDNDKTNSEISVEEINIKSLSVDDITELLITTLIKLGKEEIELTSIEAKMANLIINDTDYLELADLLELDGKTSLDEEIQERISSYGIEHNLLDNDKLIAVIVEVVYLNGSTLRASKNSKSYELLKKSIKQMDIPNTNIEVINNGIQLIYYYLDHLNLDTNKKVLSYWYDRILAEVGKSLMLNISGFMVNHMKLDLKQIWDNRKLSNKNNFLFYRALLKDLSMLEKYYANQIKLGKKRDYCVTFYMLVFWCMGLSMGDPTKVLQRISRGHTSFDNPNEAAIREGLEHAVNNLKRHKKFPPFVRLPQMLGITANIALKNDAYMLWLQQLNKTTRFRLINGGRTRADYRKDVSLNRKIFTKQIERLSQKGATDQEIVDKLKLSKRTYYEYKKYIKR